MRKPPESNEKIITLTPAEAARMLALVDASPDAATCSEAEAAEWVRRFDGELERMRDGL